MSAAADGGWTQAGDLAPVVTAPPFTSTGIRQQVQHIVAPLAVRYRGWPVNTIKIVLRRAWRDAFGGPLEEPGLGWCAEAIHSGRPWQNALWNGPDW